MVFARRTAVVSLLVHVQGSGECRLLDRNVNLNVPLCYQSGNTAGGALNLNMNLKYS